MLYILVPCAFLTPPKNKAFLTLWKPSSHKPLVKPRMRVLCPYPPFLCGRPRLFSIILFFSPVSPAPRMIPRNVLAARSFKMAFLLTCTVPTDRILLCAFSPSESPTGCGVPFAMSLIHSSLFSAILVCCHCTSILIVNPSCGS